MSSSFEELLLSLRPHEHFCVARFKTHKEEVAVTLDVSERSEYYELLVDVTAPVLEAP